MNNTFAGIEIQSIKTDIVNEFIKDELENAITYTSKKTYKHVEKIDKRNFNFEYKYIVKITDLEEYTDIDFNYMTELHLVMSGKSLCKKVYREIESSMSMVEYNDILDYGLSVRLDYNTDFETMDNAINYSIGVLNVIDIIDSLRGFYLDKYINRIGTTGFDVLKYCKGINNRLF
jgi:hypothetical protein